MSQKVCALWNCAWDLGWNDWKVWDLRIPRSFEWGDSKVLNTKLPKLEFPVFKGNPIEWKSFYDQFNISIHQSKTVSDIDRFNCLGRYLAGQLLVVWHLILKAIRER